MVPREKQGGDLFIGCNFLMSHRRPPDLFVTRNLVKLVRFYSFNEFYFQIDRRIRLK